MEGKDSLMEAFNAVRDAMLACDTAGIRELYAGEYEDFGIRGEITGRDAVLQCYRPGGVEIEEFTCHDVRCEVFGAIGIVRGKGHIKGRFAVSVFEHHVLFTDIFIFRDSRWQYYKSHSTEIQA
jgi:hypothetical protein